jgi:LPXTG-motif cell wall-anchored protein
MRRGFGVLLTAALLGALVGVPVATAPAGAAAAGPCDGGTYAAQIHTRTDLAATSTGSRARVTITVTANASAPEAVSGTVEVSGAVSRSVAYNGDPLTVGVDTRPGRTYEVRAAFTPDDPSVYACSRGRVTFTAGETPPGSPPGGPGGLLPDTGGPSSWWLALALLLLGGGGYVVSRARQTS